MRNYYPELSWRVSFPELNPHPLLLVGGDVLIIPDKQPPRDKNEPDKQPPKKDTY